MSIRSRIIPSLLIEENKLIKTTNFNKSKYVGDPLNVIKIFNDKNVDEIFIIDKSKKNFTTGPNIDLIKKMTSECFVPVCYGGGIRNINDAYNIFNLGVEKISVQKLILEDFKNLSLLVSNFGSSSIVFSVDIIKKNNRYCVYDYNQKTIYSLDFNEHIKKAIDFGAGEIYLNMVDLDGTLNGPDLKFLNEFNNLSVSIIYQGGISSVQDIINSINAGANSIAIGSYFIFYGKFNSVLISYLSKTELELINQNINV